MHRTLQEMIADLLTQRGSLVESTEDGCMDIVVTREVSKALAMPEHARLCFTYGESGDGMTYASYDSDFFRSLKRLFGGGEKFSAVRFEPPPANIEKLSKSIPERLPLRNATYRMGKSEFKEVSYLLFYFTYTALSDEKYEGMLPVLINEMNLSAVPFIGNHEGFSDDAGYQGSIERQVKEEVLCAAYAAGTGMVRERLKDFLKSLERRLNRDIRRITEYYEALGNETKKIIEKKVLSLGTVDKVREAVGHAKTNASPDTLQVLDCLEEELKTKRVVGEGQIRDRVLLCEGGDKLLGKLDAIEAERKGKIQDLVAKYAVTVQMEPVSVINIGVRVPVFWIEMRRRLASRQFPLTYNPITRHIDPLPCESCYAPVAPYSLCDEKLHIICSRCFASCPSCGKHYCKACYTTCLKCRDSGAPEEINEKEKISTMAWNRDRTFQGGRNGT